MEKTSKPAQRSSSLMQILFGALIGILLGIAGVLIYQGYLGEITNTLLYISLVFFGVVVLTFILVWGFKTYLTRLLFGSKVADSPDLIAEAQTIASQLSDGVIDKVMENATEEQREKAKGLVLRLGNWFVWGRLRNWWWSWILGIFVSLGGLTGTLLLVNQNELLQNQNNLVANQTELLNKQNKLIENQMSLEEASRRGSLVMLMSNIFDKVDDEIAMQKAEMIRRGQKLNDDTKFAISQSLIGQIAALSQAFKPYRFMDGDTLIGRPLSPERGQLLITITRLPLDTGAIRKIYEQSTFGEADLTGANLVGANLSGADLWAANLSEADLSAADLSRAYLRYAYLSESNLSEADLSEADLSEADLRKAFLWSANLSKTFLWKSVLWQADLSGANLDEADLSEANLNSTKLRKANLRRVIMRETLLWGANFWHANLNEADLSSAKYLKFRQIASARSLYRCKLPKNIDEELLKKGFPRLFKKTANSSRRK